jgi:hypothetical protein
MVMVISHRWLIEDTEDGDGAGTGSWVECGMMQVQSQVRFNAGS